MLLPPTRHIGIAVLCLCWATFAANAQNGVPTHPVDGERIPQWLLLGPFFSNDLETDFLLAAGGEGYINPKAGDTVTTAEGQRLIWKLSNKTDAISFEEWIGEYQNVTAYAFCLLQSPTPGDGEIGIHFHHGMAVWLRVYQKTAGFGEEAFTDV